jgi:hypothetical protein
VLDVDTAKGQAYFDSRKSEVDEALKGGMQAFSEYTAEEKAEVTLSAEDGE